MRAKKTQNTNKQSAKKKIGRFQEATPQLCWERKNCRVKVIGKSDSKICAEMLWPWAGPQVGWWVAMSPTVEFTLHLTIKHLGWFSNTVMNGVFKWVFTCIYIYLRYQLVLDFNHEYKIYNHFALKTPVTCGWFWSFCRNAKGRTLLGKTCENLHPYPNSKHWNFLEGSWIAIWLTN